MPYTTYLVRVRTANLEHDNILWGDFAEVLTLTTSMQGTESHIMRNRFELYYKFIDNISTWVIDIICLYESFHESVVLH